MYICYWESIIIVWDCIGIDCNYFISLVAFVSDFSKWSLLSTVTGYVLLHVFVPAVTRILSVWLWFSCFLFYFCSCSTYLEFTQWYFVLPVGLYFGTYAMLSCLCLCDSFSIPALFWWFPMYIYFWEIVITIGDCYCNWLQWLYFTCSICLWLDKLQPLQLFEIIVAFCCNRLCFFFTLVSSFTVYRLWLEFYLCPFLAIFHLHFSAYMFLSGLLFFILCWTLFVFALHYFLSLCLVLIVLSFYWVLFLIFAFCVVTHTISSFVWGWESYFGFCLCLPYITFVSLTFSN